MRGQTYRAGVQQDQLGEADVDLDSQTPVVEHVVDLQKGEIQSCLGIVGNDTGRAELCSNRSNLLYCRLSGNLPALETEIQKPMISLRRF